MRRERSHRAETSGKVHKNFRNHLTGQLRRAVATAQDRKSGSWIGDNARPRPTDGRLSKHNPPRFNPGFQRIVKPNSQLLAERTGENVSPVSETGICMAPYHRYRGAG